MAISSASSVQSLSSGFLAQIQQQQAQRNADQAEQQARSLQLQAKDAQAVASRAQEGARSLAVQAGQAQSDASNARQGVSAMKSLGEMNGQLTDIREQISAILKPSASIAANADVAATVAPSSLVPVVNSFGQQTGTVVNVTA